MRAGARWWGVGFLVVLAAPAAWAQPLAVPPGRWWQRPRVAAELGLSEEQRQTLEEVTLNHARVMIDLKAAVEKSELELRAAADTEPFDAKRVREAWATLQQARTRLENERFEMLVKIREVLSPAQWRAVTRMARERREALRGGAEGQTPEMPRRPPRPRRF